MAEHKTKGPHGALCIQIPPSRLSEDQALQRVLLWGFFFGCTPCCESWRGDGAATAAVRRSPFPPRRSELEDLS